MCGRCADGFSESLFSTDCKPNSECTFKSMFPALLAIYGLLYVGFFLLDREWAAAVKMASPLKWTCFKKKSEEPKEKGKKAYGTIFMYFVQVAALLQIDISYSREPNEELEDNVDLISSVFQFDSLGISFVNSCMLDNVTPAYKVGLKAGFIGYLFLLLAILYLIGRIIWSLVSSCCSKGITCNDTCCRIPFETRFLTTLVMLTLFTYEFLAENLLSLVHCVKLKSQSETVLFLDGTISCLQPWQFIVIGLVGIYVVPMFLIIGMTPILVSM